MMVSTCSNELKFMSERERSTKPALNGYTNPDFRELRPVDQSDGVPLSRTREATRRGERWGVRSKHARMTLSTDPSDEPARAWCS